MPTDTSNTETMRAWLHERGVGFKFAPSAVPAESLGMRPDGVSACLHLLFKDDLLTREPARTPRNRPTFVYTVLPTIAQPRKVVAKPHVSTRNRSPGYHKRGTVAPAVPTPAELVDTVLNALTALQQQAARPLDNYTNAELITELHRRNGADIDVKR